MALFMINVKMIRAICCLAPRSASLSLQSAAVSPTVVPGAPPLGFAAAVVVAVVAELALVAVMAALAIGVEAAVDTVDAVDTAAVEVLGSIALLAGVVEADSEGSATVGFGAC